jgi:hypothetical protein
MKIKHMISQHRRDFVCEYECEHCGHVVKGRGYDDRHFHEKVIPDMTCINCGAKAGPDYVPRATKYPGGMGV